MIIPTYHSALPQPPSIFSQFSLLNQAQYRPQNGRLRSFFSWCATCCSQTIKLTANLQPERFTHVVPHGSLLPLQLRQLTPHSLDRICSRQPYTFIPMRPHVTKRIQQFLQILPMVIQRLVPPTIRELGDYPTPGWHLKVQLTRKVERSYACVQLLQDFLDGVVGRSWINMSTLGWRWKKNFRVCPDRCELPIRI